MQGQIIPHKDERTHLMGEEKRKNKYKNTKNPKEENCDMRCVTLIIRDKY